MGISERSPTSVVLTLKLLRCNEGRSLEKVFDNDIKAVQFIVKHPDFIEGVRARLVEKDNDPRWRPETIGEVGILEVDIC
jgi:enoyl-CoA hydratase